MTKVPNVNILLGGHKDFSTGFVCCIKIAQNWISIAKTAMLDLEVTGVQKEIDYKIQKSLPLLFMILGPCCHTWKDKINIF